jgi:hypothetical protein
VLEGALEVCDGVADDGGTVGLDAGVPFGSEPFELSAGSSFAIGSDNLIRLLGRS